MVRSVSGIPVEPAERRSCVDCGVEIAAERAAARAPAERCVRCESERRRLEARPVTRPR